LDQDHLFDLARATATAAQRRTRRPARMDIVAADGPVA
jgi:hypothetical protein